MAWFIKRGRPFLEPELEAWHFQTWRWLIAGLGGLDSLRGTALVLPTRAFFPPADDQGQGVVAHVFDRVKYLAGMGDVACDLVAQPAQPELRVAEHVSLHRQHAAPAGTFGLQGNTPTITYDPDLENDPIKLVAVLAHELAHLRLAHFAQPLPGGRDANERATDLGTVALGFAVFGANCAFGFERFQDPITQGWRSARLGYLDEREWAFGLAVWLSLTGRDIAPAERYLKAHLVADVKSAQRSLKGRDALAGIYGGSPDMA